MLKNELLMVKLSDIHADNDFNCREKVTQISIVELAKHIREEGQISPVIIRKYDTPMDGKTWQLVAGYRRTKSLTLLAEDDPKFSVIKAMEFIGTDLEAYKMNLAENVQREELTIKEEAHAVARLLLQGMKPEEIVDEMGKSRFWVQVRQNLADLPLEIQDDVVIYKFNQNMIMELWRLETDEERYAAVRSVKDRLLKGEKVNKVAKRDRPPHKKLKPTNEEIFEGMEKVAEICGSMNMVTRAMAWCAGTAPDGEFYLDIQRYAKWLKIVRDLTDGIFAGADIETLRTIGKEII